MRQKCEGWQDEVQRLIPLEEEVEQLRQANKDLSQQLTLMVEENERKQEKAEGSGEKNMMSYDKLMERLAFFQDNRVSMEKELCHLREERTSILKENAALGGKSQPQLYANLRKTYEETVDQLDAVSKAYGDQVKLTEQLEATNMELHQKLVESTDQNKLRSIQERLDRYKKERDVARADCEGLDKKFVAVSSDLLTARDLVEARDKEMALLRTNSAKLDARMRSYREERNVARERLRELEHDIGELKSHQLSHHHSPTSTDQNGTPPRRHEEGGGNVKDTEITHSTDHEHPYSAPGSSHMPDHHSALSERLHKDVEALTLPDDSVSPTPFLSANLQAKSRITEPNALTSKAANDSSSSSLGSLNGVVVSTKKGMVTMDIQRPTAKLNFKYKPQVVVKRPEGYQAGTLMYMGRVNDKEIAGVYMDVRLQSECVFVMC